MNKEAFLAGYLSKEAGWWADTKRGAAALWSPMETASDYATGQKSKAHLALSNNIDKSRADYLKDKRYGGNTTFTPTKHSSEDIGGTAIGGYKTPGGIGSAADPNKAYKMQREQAAYMVRENLRKKYGQEKGDSYYDTLSKSKDFGHKTLKDYHKYNKYTPGKGNDAGRLAKSTAAVTKRATPIIRNKVIGDAISKYAPLALGALGMAGSAYMMNRGENRRHKELLKAIQGRKAKEQENDRIFRLSRTGRSM